MLGHTTAPASSASATTPTRTCRGRSPPRHAGGWASVTAGDVPHLRHPHRWHPVVLGLQLRRRARHRHHDRAGPAPAGHHPGRGRLGQRHRRLQPHLRHPHRRHPVVLGLQRRRPARHRQPHRPGPAAAGHHPGAGRAGPASPPAICTPAPPAPAAPCGAGATTNMASSVSATTPARTCPGRSPSRRGRLDQRQRRRVPHLRHPHRRHPVVLGRQQLRPARHRQPRRPGPARGRSPAVRSR